MAVVTQINRSRWFSANIFAAMGIAMTGWAWFLTWLGEKLLDSIF
jgi:hypothetical protein